MANSSYANTSTLTTDFNVTPYYDDYDKTKQYYRILFKPGYAVQARELTQSQTMLQKQVDRFGKHVFKEGSIVLPGKFTFENDLPYIKVRDNDSANASVTVTNYIGQTLTSNTGIKAFVTNVVDGAETSANTKTLYVRYLSSNASANLSTFQPNEVLSSNAGTIVVASNTGSNTVVSGKASRFIIEEGVFFAKEHFIYFPTQSVILDRYGISPTCQVGFNITEEIVNYTQDISLLDPALEATNYAAPGADRLKLTPTLTRLEITEAAGAPDYVQLFVVRDGLVELNYEKSQYSVINDYFADRTYNESGDYYVNGMDVRIRENLNNGINYGYLTANNGGNANLLSIGVEAGRAFVKGYETGNLQTRWTSTDKATTAQNVSGQIISARFGTYILANEYAGVATHNTGDTVLLYDTARQSLTGRTWSTGAGSGSVIGTAKIKSVEYENGTLGTPNGVVSVYMSDIKMNGSNSFTQTRSLQVVNDIGSSTFCDAILNPLDGNPTLYDPGSTLIYSVGSNFVKTIRASDLTSVDTNFIYKKTSAVTVTTGGAITLSLDAGGPEEFPYSAGTLSAGEELEMTVSFDTSFNVALTGTTSGTVGTQTITGSGTFFTRLNIGSKVEFAGISGQTFYVTGITSNTLMTVDTILPSTLSGAAYFKAYKQGDVLSLNGVGVGTGNERSITVDASQKIMVINLEETYASPASAVVTYRVADITAREIKKDLRPNRFSKISCASAGTTGPFYLGISDVYKVREIRVASADFSSNTQGTVATSNFDFNNGQKDEYYDHASITPKSGYTLSASNYILIEYDFFEPDATLGNGYFSVDSYPVNDVTTSNTSISTAEIPVYKSINSGNKYDLRNSLDFRPLKVNQSGAGVAAVVSATSNPLYNVGFLSTAARVPAPDSQVNFSYSFYLGRKDVVAIDKDNNIVVVRGEPAAVPITPTVDKAAPNSMALATLTIAPYPSLSPQYAGVLNRKDLSCSVNKTAAVRFTMRDIGTLRSRIENLEYYASLSLLEKSALDMKILDVNGLDRFKNGLFTDTFANHLLGATYDPQYNIVVDQEEKSIRPIYNMESIAYDYTSGSGVQYHANSGLITLPYTESVFASQNAVSTLRNIETSSYKFIGQMYLDPPQDFWVDTQFEPDNHVTIGANSGTPSFGTTWNSWQKIVTGYNLYASDSIATGGVGVAVGGGGVAGTVGNRGRLLGTFATLEEAKAQAIIISRNVTLGQNSIGYTGTKTATIIEEVATNSRTGSESYGTSGSDTVSLGDRVIETAIIPYIRPKIINIEVRGMKSNTRYFSFFDNENMNNYSAPLTNTGVAVGSTGNYSNSWAIYDNFYFAPGANSASLISSSDGTLRYALQIPAADGAPRFRVGTKEVVVTDSPTNAADATSLSRGYYVAQGIQQTKQGTVLTTRTIISQQRAISESNDQPQDVFSQPLGPSCMAYSFLAKAPQGEEGIFLTSADVFIRSTHPTLGVWFELREMDSSGGITRNSIPFSEVWYTAKDIAPYLSDDGTKAFNVKFPAPVFLYNNTQYAFVIHTEGLNPDTYFWVSRLGDTDIITGSKITSRALTGTLYTTNNNLNWDMVPDLDMKINFYRAKFTVGSGTATLGNKPIEILELSNVTRRLDHYGEMMRGTRVNLSGANIGNVYIGTTLTGANTNASVTVIGTSGSDFIVTSNLALIQESAYVGGVSTGNTVTITSVARANGFISKFIASASNNVLRLSPSSGIFKANDVLIGELSGDQANVAYLANLNYSVVDFEPAYINFAKTATQFKMSTDSGSTKFNIQENRNFYLSSERSIKSHTYEGGNPSNQVDITLSTSSEYLSPVIDVDRTHTIAVENIINANSYGETNSTGGLITNKYLSKVVTLAQGQDAEDINLVITSYRPPQSNVKVYMRMSHAEDFEPISQRNWFEMNYDDASIYSSVANQNDFKEYVFNIPTANLTSANVYTYTNSSNTTFSGFKQFQVKIGLVSDDPAYVPRVADLRILALQV